MRLRSVQIVILLLLIGATAKLQSQDGFTELFYPDDSITEVQPMTGIVFWHNSSNSDTDVISLEFSYMLFNEVVADSGVYDWSPVEEKLNAIASRNHQAIFRFRYVYPGYESSVPQYILEREDYHETIGNSEGKETHFPDWTNDELKRFTLEFYTKFAERYDDDPRLAFVQVGFGLWAEYHIYSGPFTLGETFPSKEFQEVFFRHLDTTFKNIPWSISIDAADDTYSPFVEQPELKEIHFGLFDDSFMHQNHAGYNTSNWNFFDRERYKTSPAGGEFSYYSDYDQEHVLDYPEGPYGKPYETFAKDFHISYIMGNDQPRYQTMERIRQAGMASGYKFKIVRVRTNSDSTLIDILNYGVAPIYYDAYPALEGVRSDRSLKLHIPGDTIRYSIAAGAEGAELTIECDKLLDGQEIQYHGTQALPVVGTRGMTITKPRGGIQIYPNPVKYASQVYIQAEASIQGSICTIYNASGKVVYSERFEQQAMLLPVQMEQGMYVVQVVQGANMYTDRLIIL
jgi:hypothetical protein